MLLKGVVILLYILLVVSFLLGGLSHKVVYADIFSVLSILLFFIFMPLVFYHSAYEYNGTASGVAYLSEMLVGRTLAILKHFGEPIRTLVLIQPLSYLLGKMCFEVRKTIQGASR